MDDRDRDRRAGRPPDLLRCVQAEQLRPPFHDAHGHANGPRVPRADSWCQGDREPIESPGFEIAEAFRFLCGHRVEPPELVLDIVVRGALVDGQLHRDLPIGGAGDPQVEGLLGTGAPLGIVARRAFPGRTCVLRRNVLRA